MTRKKSATSLTYFMIYFHQTISGRALIFLTRPFENIAKLENVFKRHKSKKNEWQPRFKAFIYI
jgi:hypothetical protein